MASSFILNKFELDILDIDKLLNEEDDEIWLVAPSSHGAPLIGIMHSRK